MCFQSLPTDVISVFKKYVTHKVICGKLVWEKTFHNRNEYYGILNKNNVVVFFKKEADSIQCSVFICGDLFSVFSIAIMNEYLCSITIAENSSIFLLQNNEVAVYNLNGKLMRTIILNSSVNAKSSMFSVNSCGEIIIWANKYSLDTHNWSCNIKTFASSGEYVRYFNLKNRIFYLRLDRNDNIHAISHRTEIYDKFGKILKIDHSLSFKIRDVYMNSLFTTTPWSSEKCVYFQKKGENTPIPLIITEPIVSMDLTVCGRLVIVKRYADEFRICSYE